jgi:SAM-dependent methyltransferase
MESHNEWGRYQKITKDNKPRHLAICLKNFLYKEMSIIDIGCGAGTDSMYFIEQGCFVNAIDKVTNGIEHRKLELRHDIKDKLSIINGDFTNMEFPVCDAVYASFSLPFCNPNNFNKFWINIEKSVREGGIFAGIFFGVNDDWYNISKNITFHRKYEIEELLKTYNIKKFEEKEYDGQCVGEKGNVIDKHWHIYEVIAIKNKSGK